MAGNEKLISLENTVAGWKLQYNALLDYIILLQRENDQHKRNHEMHKRVELFGNVNPAYQLAINNNEAKIELLKEEARKIAAQLLCESEFPIRSEGYIFGGNTEKSTESGEATN